jgi:uncharacterized protein YecE (DUF72 family)
VQTLVGTSGYSYPWNPKRPSAFEWYLAQGFNTVEINSTFYRFPAPSSIRVWSLAPAGFAFSIKVHRSITHYTKLGSVGLWQKFMSSFAPLEKRIKFWLFQFPESFAPTDSSMKRITHFLDEVSLDGKAVLEFRRTEWWRYINNIQELGAVFCSVDAPALPRELAISRGTVYLRVHGRGAWYDYVYSYRELLSLATKLRRTGAKTVAVYFNNDTGMLENALTLSRILGARGSGGRTRSPDVGPS